MRKLAVFILLVPMLAGALETILSPVIPYTNSFSATNVSWNVTIRTEQVLEVTNAMLLIITNTASAASGTRSRLVFINNKATNMNVAITADGLRVFGGPLATAVSFTVTNGRTAIVEYQRLGTNNNLTVFQQQN